MRIVISLVLGLACFASAAPAHSGGDCTAPKCCVQSCQPTCCSGCGHKSCQLVCDVKKVKRTVWVVECEEFCVPNPRCAISCGKRSCCNKHRADSCGGCCDGCPDVCADRRRCLVPPRCGKVRCRKKLIKKEITCEIPIYKCVVCGTCCDPGCCEEGGGVIETAPAKAKAPAAPSPTAMVTKQTRTR